MSRAVKIKDYKAFCYSGDVAVEAWAPFPKSLIVVHQKIGHSGLFGDFILAHRTSGMSVLSWAYHYSTKRAALKAARKIAKYPEWSKWGRPTRPGEKIPGLTKNLALALRRKIDKALSNTSDD